MILVLFSRLLSRVIVYIVYRIPYLETLFPMIEAAEMLLGGVVMLFAAFLRDHGSAGFGLTWISIICNNRKVDRKKRGVNDPGKGWFDIFVLCEIFDMQRL